MTTKIEDYVPDDVTVMLRELVVQRPVPLSTDDLPGSASTKRRILDAAFSLFVEARIDDFTMRNLANRIDMRVGNLTYHYKTKSKLLEALAQDRLATYAEEILATLQLSEPSPRRALDRIVSLLVQDLRRPEIAFFPQLWALALFDPVAERLMDQIHELERRVFAGLVRTCRPDWSDVQCDAFSLHITAAIEGLTLFIGRNKQTKGVYASPDEEIHRVMTHILEG